MFPSPASSPCIAAFPLLPLHWELAERLGKGSWTGNALPGGEMEVLETMLQAGWKQERSEPAGVKADAVSVAPGQAQVGINLTAEKAAAIP